MIEETRAVTAETKTGSTAIVAEATEEAGETVEAEAEETEADTRDNSVASIRDNKIKVGTMVETKMETKICTAKPKTPSKLTKN